MTPPNISTLWGRVIVDELVKQGINAVCIAPGSRSTPLVVPLAAHPDVTVYTHLDERSAGFFALGRAKHTGKVTPVVSTSGTAVANFHPAVIEADQSRVPFLVISADRPPVLHESGANQTVPQGNLFTESIRWSRTFPEPGAEEQKIRSVRTTIARGIAISTGSYPGPVHFNIPFSKPLAPIGSECATDSPEVTVPGSMVERDGPYTTTYSGKPTLPSNELRVIQDLIRGVDRGLIIAGPTNPFNPATQSILELAESTQFPVLADPLSGIRFHPRNKKCLVSGGYDSYLAEPITHHFEPPELVLQFGANPTSVQLQEYIKRNEPRQILIDPAAGWREGTFTATELVITDPDVLASKLSRTNYEGNTDWASLFSELETFYWERLGEMDSFHEGRILNVVLENVPPESIVFVGNSMPIRDLDRFVQPKAVDLSLIGNRGASGIDGNISTAIGAGSDSEAQVVAVLGDIAFYHDMNGLLAITQCEIDITVVVINNDGGGIFHMLPIADFDPPFTSNFRMPHGLEYASAAALYDIPYDTVNSLESLTRVFTQSVSTEGSQIIELKTDGEESHQTRRTIQAAVEAAFEAKFDE